MCCIKYIYCLRYIYLFLCVVSNIYIVYDIYICSYMLYQIYILFKMYISVPICCIKYSETASNPWDLYNEHNDTNIYHRKRKCGKQVSNLGILNPEIHRKGFNLYFY